MAKKATLIRVLCLLAVGLIIQNCGDDPPLSNQTSFIFEPAKSLSREDREVENRFAGAIASNLNVFIAAYRWKWPKVVNTDNARELCQEYAPDGFDLMTEKNKEHRTKYALGTQAVGRALAMEVYKQMLQEQPTGSEKPLVVFTAGGAGSGKSTSFKAVKELRDITDRAQIIFDTTLSSQISQDQIKMALDANRVVQIFYIYRDPEAAFLGALTRAKLTGRPVTVSNFMETHLGAPAALDSVEQRFFDEIKNGTLRILVVDNTSGRDFPEMADEGVNFVRQRAPEYSSDRLRKLLEGLLNDAYDKGEISKTLFEAINK